LFGQVLDDAREAPLKLAVGGKSVNKENRLAAAFNGIMDGHAVGIKRLIGRSNGSNQAEENCGKDCERDVSWPLTWRL